MPVTQFPSVGVSHLSKRGVLSLDDERQVIEYQDHKDGATTVLASPEDKVARATWAEIGRRDAILKLYMADHENQDVLIVEDGADGESQENGNKRKRKMVPRFYRVYGLNLDAEEKVKSFLKSAYQITLESTMPDVRGINFGEAHVSKLERALIVRDPENDAREVLELPLSGVSQVAMPSKNEIEVQYSLAPKEEQADPFELTLVRLYVPSNEDEPVPKDGEQDEENPEGEALTAVDRVYREVKEILDMYDEADEAALGLVCSISEEWCNFTAPKGKYRMDLYKDFLRLRGKSYDYKISYDNIIQMHLLDHPEINARFLVIALVSGVRVGQQTYSYLVVLITDEDGELQFAMSDEELARRYPDGALAQTRSGKMPEVIAKVLKVVSSKKVFVMPANGFQAYHAKGLEEGIRPDRCVRATYKTFTGFLYPMKSSLMFLPARPVLSISFKDIKSIEFRAQQSGRAFDMVLQVSGRSQNTNLAAKDDQLTTVEFVQIPRDQFEVLSKYFSESTSIAIKDKGKLSQIFARTASKAGATIMDMVDGDDSEDEEDSDFDAEKTKKKKSKDGDGESSDDESDDESSGGSGSSSSDDDSDMAEEVSEDEDVLRTLTGGDVQGKRKRVASGEKKKKKASDDSPKKKKRDPNLPKNARNAYTFFTEEKLKELKAANEGKPQSEIMKMIGDMWRELDDKTPYEERAKQDKERHLKEMELYRAENPDAAESGKKAKKKKDKDAPKGARNAYAFFQEEMRPTLKEKGITSLGELSKHVADLWKNMSESDRAKYTEMAAQDKERYTKEMDAYRAEHPEMEDTKKVAGTKKRVSTAERPAQKKKVVLGGGELPSDDDSSSDDSTSEDE